MLKKLLVLSLTLLSYTHITYADQIEDYCKKVSDAAGGSYVILESCIKSETDAKQRLGSSESKKQMSAPTARYNTKDPDFVRIQSYMGSIPLKTGMMAACGLESEANSLKHNFNTLYELYRNKKKNFPVLSPPLLDQVKDQETTWCTIRSCATASETTCAHTLSDYLDTKKSLEADLKKANRIK